jgi:hypothetical protein
VQVPGKSTVTMEGTISYGINVIFGIIPLQSLGTISTIIVTIVFDQHLYC